MKKTKSRILASFVAVMLCFTAFSTVAFANGNDPEAKPETTASTEQAEETEAPTTGGIEDTADADENASDTAETETMTEEDVAELLSSLFGSQVEVTTTDSGLQITSNGEAASTRTGTVTTNGGNLNVRTRRGDRQCRHHPAPQWDRGGGNRHRRRLGENPPAGARGLCVR